MLPDTIPIYQDQDFYVPSFTVKIGDERLKRDVVYDITDVSYMDNLKEIDSFEITINNWDAEKLTFKYSDGDLFLPGKKVELHMGYLGRGDLRRMLIGEITSLTPSFPEAGQPTLKVSGLNELHSLRKEEKSRYYERKTDNQIAEEVAGYLEIDIQTVDGAAGSQENYDYIFQYKQSDILFLMERASRIGYDIYIEDNQEGGRRLYFGPSLDVRETTYEFNYGRSLRQFSPNLTTATQVYKVTVRGWNAVRGELIEKTVTRDEIRTRGVGRAADQEQIERAFNERQEVIVDRPINRCQEAITMAREILEDNAKEMITGEGSVVGLPDLRAGSVVYLTGLGTRFSGRYFVTKTTHTINSGGYTTTFSCRREELREEQRE